MRQIPTLINNNNPLETSPRPIDKRRIMCAASVAYTEIQYMGDSQITIANRSQCDSNLNKNTKCVRNNGWI